VPRGLRMPNFALSRIKTYALRVALLLTCATPVCAQTYDPALITPQILGAPTTMTPLNLGDDNTRQVALGFEFEYWGQTFIDVWVSSNGFVSFQSGNHLCCNGQPIDQAQRNTIYAYWSDIISFTGNPYYRVSDGAALFGWYNVQEYGTNNSNTFEIALFDNGNIQFNYGSLSASGWRDFTAGITGAEADQNVALFYGRDPQFLQNQSGLLTYGSPIPDEVAIDCNATPLHPSCPPVSISIDVGAPDPTENAAETAAETALEAAVASVEQAAMEETQEEVQIEDVADIEQVLETAQEALETANESVEADDATQADEAVETDAIEELVSERDLEDLGPDEERLSPDEVAALAADGPESATESQDASSGELEQESSNQLDAAFEEGGGATQDASFGDAAQTSQSSAFENSTQSTQGFGSFQMRVDFGSGASGASGGGNSGGVGSSPIDAAISAGGPVSMTTTFEILNNVGGGAGVAPVAASGSSEKSESEMAEGQSETIAEMGSVPAFNAYRQVALSDRADFYAIRDIYRNRRLRDANFEMYRMTQTNDAKWREIVDAQYK
jgi:hypothetical protein